MATIKYLLQSKAESSPIYLRLSLQGGIDIKRKTGLFINYKEWSKATGLPKQTKSGNKNLSIDLGDLREFILKEINIAASNGTEITGDWLLYKINIYFKRISESSQSEYITDVIDNLIDNAKFKRNGKGGIGLSKSRINSYNSLKNIIVDYEKERKFKVVDVNVKFANDLLKELIQFKKYSKNYAIKKIADLKTVCFSAEVDGIRINEQFKKIHTPTTDNDFIIFLTPEEQKKISDAIITNPKLNNARKWLLLGCNIGQRGGDLLDVSIDNFHDRNGLKVIELKQQKTGINITIPVLEETEKILESGLPYKISLQKLNEYIKEVCKIAEIDTPTEGLIFDKKLKRKKLGIYQKWELITSHVCRRSFASNNYTILPTPLLMQITGHKTERMFLKYIGKTSLDYAQQIADFYTLTKLREQKTSNLTVVKSAL